MAPIVLGYWKIRGLAQSIRLILGYTDTEFTETVYEQGDGPDFDRSCWYDVKEKLGLDFPNLPYLEDGNLKITQSNAIMRYIARKHKLVGETDEEKTQADMLENVATDLRTGYTLLIYLTPPDQYQARRKGYVVEKKVIFGKFSKYLGNNNYFVGNKLTYIDFILYELFHIHRLFADELLSDYDNLQEFIKRFEEIPKIKSFTSSNKCFNGPLNNKSALFN